MTVYLLLWKSFETFSFEIKYILIRDLIRIVKRLVEIKKRYYNSFVKINSGIGMFFIFYYIQKLYDDRRDESPFDVFLNSIADKLICIYVLHVK